MKITINNKQIAVWLPNELFNNLREQLNQYNELGNKPKLNLAIASYILNLMYYIPLKSDDKYNDDWIPICSDSFKNLKYFTTYINFLVENEFIIKHDKDYSTSSKKCRRYKLGSCYIDLTLTHHTLEDNAYYIKKINLFKIDRMKIADAKCIHLTKWLNPELLSIDYNNAIKHTNLNYSGKRNTKKRNKRVFSIESIHNKSWSYSREGKDDRLHSILTSLPKDLRCYIKYNNESLIAYDIKNSQPFIYTTILNQLINPNVNLINCYLNNSNHMLYTSIMSDLFRGTLNNEEIQSFITQVLDGTFYEEYGKLLYLEGLLSKDVCNNYYLTTPTKYSNSWRIELKKFEGLRKASKYVVLQTLYSSDKCHSKEIKVFKKYFPEIFMITQFIKKGREKNFFPILMQNIEANCLLDYCTAKIAKKHPNMPLFTIHDSIITTSDYQSILEEEFEKYLKLYFGLTPKLEAESWNIKVPIAS
ncbi:hypothetical protein SAMN04488111_1856 [Lutibacter flavus]|uniref:DNA-directed RNA polymerase n=2 Tax=Lutibacter flavus TaxID=691689 RepID=A0A238XI86_9FLAO|nr:hypothetical protein SAMN04488111_1856 [Lutibacter flavus]